MAAAEILVWLAKTIGGQAIKDRICRAGLKRQNRVLMKALEESQQRREELEDAARIVAEIAVQRDGYFTEILRLRAENAALQAEVQRLAPGG